ncbi:hypothetical protein HK100_010480 [Physocladia obscura]|uniref:assimilatory sulfite reductase (NADPH) n=1 Tax=Physocladia obscura TaxID=109957 RepID=A0AAD5XKU4_9FUNG|nr:hypothetical protein HK100_010480 [Physocladia obscura]
MAPASAESFVLSHQQDSNSKESVGPASSLIVSWAISGKKVVVVGGDQAAASRAAFAAEAGAHVTILTEHGTAVSSALRQLLTTGKFLVHETRAFDAADLRGASLVFVCLTGADRDRARQIALLCRANAVPVNVATASELSDFFFMSTYKDQVCLCFLPLTPAIILAAKLRKQIVNSIPTHAGSALENLAKLRQHLKLADQSATSNNRRMNFINKVSETWSVETLADLTDSDISALVKNYLSQASDLPRLKAGTLRVIRTGFSGRVDHLTVEAFRSLSQAELVISDNLVSKDILDLVAGDLMVVPADAERASNSVIFAALRALELGQHVIRLKYGSDHVDVEFDDELSVFYQKGFKAVVVPTAFVAATDSKPYQLNFQRDEKIVVQKSFVKDEITLFKDIPNTIPKAIAIPAAIVSKKAPIAAAGLPKFISGEDAAAHVAFALSDMSFVYQVIPESTIGESPAKWAANGIKNAKGKSHKVTQVETRVGAAAVVHGAAHDGSAVVVLANSGALRHMLPSMHRIAQEHLPVVFHVAAQGIKKDPLFTVYPSIADVTATSFTGFASIGSGSVKEAHDLALVAHVSASAGKTPFLHFYDGTRIATEQSIVPIIDTASLAKIVKDAGEQASALKSIPVPDLVENVMNNLAEQLGHNYKLFEYIGSNTAETVVVALGSSAAIAEEAVGRLFGSNIINVGLLKIRLLRPWSARHFLGALPRTVKKIVLIDDSKEQGSGSHGALFLDVTSAFYDSVWSLPIPTILKGGFAEGVENFNSVAVQLFLENLDVTDYRFDFEIVGTSTVASADSNVFEAVIWDQQSDETEKVANFAVQLLEAQGASNVQLFQTSSSIAVEPISATHLRFSKTQGAETAQSAALVTSANYAAVHNISFLSSFNVAASIRKNGTLLINRAGANPTIADVSADIPEATKRELYNRHIRIAVVDADKIAFNYTLFRGNRKDYRNLALVGALAKLWDGVDAARALAEVEAGLEASETDGTVFRTKIGALKSAVNGITVFDAPGEWAFASADQQLPTFFEPTFGFKKLTGLDNEDAGEVVGKIVPKYAPALPIMFKEAYGLKSALRPDAAEKTFKVTVTENRRLTPDSYERNVFHIEFDIGSSGLKYEIGEALGVYGQNNPDHVQEFLDWYGADGSQIIRFDRRNEATGTTETEFRTVTQLFTEVVDIFGKPGKKFFQSLIEHTTVLAERERLGFLASGEGADELAKLQEEETVTFADVLQMFPSSHPSIEKLLSLIPNIKPRHYSISSSMNVHPTSVHLLVVVVDWKTKSGKDRVGQCTRYLVNLRPGKTVTVSVKPSVMKLPPSHTAPVIMAGLGTGMAPFRAFVEERAYQKSLGHEVGPMALYFGARHRAEEYLYGEELEAYHADGLLTHLRLAFSRDQKEKVYIQHKIQDDSEMLGDMMLKDGGAFYLCGPTWPVPDVRDALVSAFSNSMSENEASEKLEALKEQERYVLEVY